MKADSCSEHDIQQAVESEEFVLYFQPQFNVEKAAFDGAEALVRWRHPEKGLLTPDSFIPAIEDQNCMPFFGSHVLSMAADYHKRWREKELIQFRMSVNVSWSQLDDDSFLAFIRQIKKEGDFPDDMLELELTENVVLHMNEAKMVSLVTALKKEEISVALDDFGTGYASIGYLKQVPFDRIKIDKSYVVNIHEDKKDRAIVRAILALGESLHLQVVAEGVESLKHMQLLSREGCKEMQGYYFSKPLPPEEFEDFMHFYQNNTFL